VPRPHNKQPSEGSMNIVEWMADDDEVFWDQPCKWGCRIEGHAVYCNNKGWAEAPRKCRRTWYTGGKVRDEDCPGYWENPNRKPGDPA